MPLNSNQVKTMKAGVHADGGGLYLHVRESGERVWAFRFTDPTASGRRWSSPGLATAKAQAVTF